MPAPVNAGLNVRTVGSPGDVLSFSLERMGPGDFGAPVFYDASDHAFRATPATKTIALAEGAGIDAGSFAGGIDPAITAGFPDGDYCVRIYKLGAVVAVLGCECVAGSFGPDRHLAAFVRGRATPNGDGSAITFADPADQTTPRLKYTAAGAGRTVALDTA